MRRREFITLLGGAVATWSRSVQAQQSDGERRVGVLLAFAESDSRPQAWLASFTKGLAELGWATGQQTRIHIRWAGNDVNLMQKYAKELVVLKPNDSVRDPCHGSLLQRETRTIPIVFAIVSDPVGEGFVSTPSTHPGGNITGFHNSKSLYRGEMVRAARSDRTPESDASP